MHRIQNGNRLKMATKLLRNCDMSVHLCLTILFAQKHVHCQQCGGGECAAALIISAKCAKRARAAPRPGFPVSNRAATILAKPAKLASCANNK